MQNGSLIETKRQSGQSVWEFRWRDRTSGKAVYRRIVVGTTEQLTSEVEARELVEGIVLEINSDDPRLRSSLLTMSHAQRFLWTQFFVFSNGSGTDWPLWIGLDWRKPLGANIFFLWVWQTTTLRVESLP